MNDLAEQQAKRALRQEFLQRRRQLSAAEAAAASAEICRRLSACLAERLRPEQPGAVFSYLAYGGFGGPAPGALAAGAAVGCAAHAGLAGRDYAGGLSAFRG